MKKFLIALLFLATKGVFASTVSCAPDSQQANLQQAVKWYRDSAEKTALYRQAYNVATNYINQWVKTNHPKPKTWGVILDIDETTLDNSWYYFACGSIDKESAFEHYVTLPQKSIAEPGVVAFTQLVHQLGGYVTMLSNRDGSYVDNSGNALAATVANLKQQHVYFDQVVLGNYETATNPTDKNPRFNAIISGKYDAQQMVWSNKLPPHQVIAYFGDNIQDFPKFKQASMYALAPNSKEFAKFGAGYFILPNPIYGSWGQNLYH